MSKRNKIDTKEIGLDISIVLAKYLLKTDHLHYGYWTDDLERNIFNIPKAQEKYSEFIISHIPDNISSILDVDCVSPSDVFYSYTKERLQQNAEIFKSKFEDVQTAKKYDLILFSESFQYINLEKAFQNSLKILKPKGYILICDFFKTAVKGTSPLSGGHGLGNFFETIDIYPFSLVKDIDITKQTAPNIDLYNEFLLEAGFPIWKIIVNLIKQKYKLLYNILKWKYKKKNAKIHRKYFSGQRNSRNFLKFKTYRLFIYQKTQ